MLAGQWSLSTSRRSALDRDKQFKCPFPNCGKQYFERRNLWRHNKDKHGGLKFDEKTLLNDEVDNPVSITPKDQQSDSLNNEHIMQDSWSNVNDQNDSSKSIEDLDSKNREIESSNLDADVGSDLKDVDSHSDIRDGQGKGNVCPEFHQESVDSHSDNRDDGSSKVDTSINLGFQDSYGEDPYLPLDEWSGNF